MMMRTLRLASLVAGCLGVAAASLGAQQIPGTAAKNAARRVVAATNAHISAISFLPPRSEIEVVPSPLGPCWLVSVTVSRALAPACA